MQKKNINTKDLSIILVNYRTKELLLNCLRSINKETTEVEYEIIVVDNASNDDSKICILKEFPKVIWIQMEYNSGFARANNEGIKKSSGQKILLLNTDTIIKEKAIEKVISLFDSDKDYKACGVQLLNEDGSHQISGAQVMIGGLNTLLALPYLGRIIRFLGYLAKIKKPSIDTVPEKLDVDWIIGAFIMVRKETIENAGLLDEDFFMYSEEMEWCARIKKYGKLCLFGNPKVVHLGGGSSKSYYNSDIWNNEHNLCTKKGKQLIVSNSLRIRKEFGIFWLFITEMFYLLNIPIFFIFFILDVILHLGKTKFEFKHFTAFVKNIILLQQYIPKMIIGKPYFYKVK